METPKAILGREGSNEADMEPMQFSDWNEALSKEALPVVRRDLFRSAIVRFLRHCKVVRACSDTRAWRPRIGCAHAACATQIYMHVMEKPGLGERSPLDLLGNL